jgi:hypothetical protein
MLLQSLNAMEGNHSSAVAPWSNTASCHAPVFQNHSISNSIVCISRRQTAWPDSPPWSRYDACIRLHISLCQHTHPEICAVGEKMSANAQDAVGITSGSDSAFPGSGLDRVRWVGSFG